MSQTSLPGPTWTLAPFLAFLTIAWAWPAGAAEGPVGASGSGAASGAASGGAWAKDDAYTSDRAAWYRDAKFGMFIHWGLYSALGGEWKGQRDPQIGEWIMHHMKIPIPEYETIAARFNPVKFNADEWVGVAKDAGMRYMVITSKHHDGFCMWPTKVTPYNIHDATPFKRDPMKELSEACKRQGLKFAFYHSLMDWHHPELAGYWGAGPDAAKDPNDPRVVKYVEGQLKPQLKELVTWYDPAILWFDGEWVPWWTQERGQEIEQYLHSLKPDIIVNNRVGKRKLTDGDYETPEQEIPRAALGKRLWETCMTLNDTWGYKSFDQNWKGSREVIRKLADIAGKGGNFLLNVGPTGEGVIPEPSVRILHEVGQWLKPNGEAIYGTTFATAAPPKWGSITRKGNTLYPIVFDWPKADAPLVVPAAGKVESARLLHGTGEVRPYSPKDNTEPGLQFLLPAMMPTPPAGVVVLEFEGDPKVMSGRTAGEVVPASIDGTYTLPAGAANLKGATIRVEPGGNVGFWTKRDEYAEWLIDNKKAGPYEVELTYAVGGGAGGGITVSAADQQIAGKAVPTGGWQTYKTVKVGTLRLPAGKVAVTVKPAGEIANGLMNLQTVKLTPVQ